MNESTTEHAFETHVERVLQERGWRSGDVAAWNVKRALFPGEVCAFLETTQPRRWNAMRQLHGDKLEPLVVDSLCKELSTKGTLHVLRHGFKVHGRPFQMAYFKPAHGLNTETLALYAKNDLAVTRQVPCRPGKGDTVDLLFSLNGLPVATCELKNPGTGQTWRDAEAQYKRDRDPRGAPLLGFKSRAVVHFAADTERVSMTTRLDGNNTRFLPFDRGSAPGDVTCGAGNPAHSSGWRTGYFWEDVLERDGFIDILGHFMFVETTRETEATGQRGKRAKRLKKETLIFPRYHQLDAVRQLVKAARADGPGRNYLVQHSAGSGKTNSISWLSHRLASLHDSADQKVFDCVIVVTDRRVLDSQLQDAIYQIEHAQGVVKRIDRHSKQLAEALVDGTKIVVTTLQKFPYVLPGLLRVAGAESADAATSEERATAGAWREQIARRKYAIVVDEAHSSQTGETARRLKDILGAGSGVAGDEVVDDPEADGADWHDGLNAVLASRGRQPNLSFFAFTATPKGKTLEIFGRRTAQGAPEAFHVYSMRQAIEEGFILDVLSNYTTYSTYWRLLKKASEDPELPKRKAARALAKFMALHPHNIAQKTEVTIEHFRRHVMGRINGRAKAMVVTGSRLHAVRYMLSFRRYIAEKGYDDVRPLVAFSGKVRDPDTEKEYTEPGMNTDPVSGRQIGEAALAGRFASHDFNVLLVANKYQTGFDQPLLCAMYVDKRLDGVQAVQTLSRLNRTHEGKEAPFVLDFVNDAEDIRLAFKPYYDKTELEAEADPTRLEALKHELGQAQVYYWSEVDAFAKIYFGGLVRPRPDDHARLQGHLRPAVDRFAAIPEDEDRREFRDKLAAYVQLYEFMSQIVPYGDSEWEKLYAYGHLLLALLAADREPGLKLEEVAALEFYRLQRRHTGRLRIAEGDAQPIAGPTDVGTGAAEEPVAPLSEIIALLNERHGTDLTEADRLFFEEVKAEACADEEVVSLAHANAFPEFTLAMGNTIRSLMVERLGKNNEIVTRYMDDDQFRATAFPFIAKAIYEAARANARQ